MRSSRTVAQSQVPFSKACKQEVLSLEFFLQSHMNCSVINGPSKGCKGHLRARGGVSAIRREAMETGGTNGEQQGESREIGAELSGPAAGMDGREKVWRKEGSRVTSALGFGDFGICYSPCWKRLVTFVSL